MSKWSNVSLTSQSLLSVELAGIQKRIAGTTSHYATGASPPLSVFEARAAQAHKTAGCTPSCAAGFWVPDVAATRCSKLRASLHVVRHMARARYLVATHLARLSLSNMGIGGSCSAHLSFSSPQERYSTSAISTCNTRSYHVDTHQPSAAAFDHSRQRKARK